MIAIQSQAFPLTRAQRTPVWRRIAAGMVFTLAGVAAHADNINLLNTGQLTLPAGNGSFFDLGWQVVAGPGITTPVQAYVASRSDPLPNSQFIWVSPTGNGVTGQPYTFRTTFDLTGFDPASAQLSGDWRADDSGESILLNGATPIGSGFSTNINPKHFSITGGFIAGINTLDFLVTDQANPGGLDVGGLSGTANRVAAVPEPSSALLLLAGLIAIPWLVRQRAKTRQ